MTALASPHLFVLLRRRTPQTKEEWMLFIAILILLGICYLYKEKVFQGTIKWLVGIVLFIIGIIGMFLSPESGLRFFFWCLTGALIYTILFELLKKFTMNRRNVYSPPSKKVNNAKKNLTSEEEIDINKIVIVILVVWGMLGLWVTGNL